jgi:hypothetical protein
MVSDLLAGMVGLVVAALNALIAAIGAVLSVLFSILPTMPDLPDLPDAITTAESWVAWFFPVGTVVDILTFVAAMWLLFQIVALVLRWAKATSE